MRRCLGRVYGVGHAMVAHVTYGSPTPTRRLVYCGKPGLLKTLWNWVKAFFTGAK